MRVYVVMEDYWNGEYSAKRISQIFSAKEDAARAAEAGNSAKTSSYSSEYEVEEFNVE